MLGTLSSYPDWLLCGQGRAVNQNDALIFYFFRNVMMAVLFTTSTILYCFRHRTINSWKTHVIVLIGCIFFISVILTLSWVHSSHSPWLNIDFIDNLTFTFTPLWHSRIGLVLIIIWSLTLILLIYVTQLRNIFWYSGAFFCSAYIFTLMMLLSSASSSNHSWSQARLFGTSGTTGKNDHQYGGLHHAEHWHFSRGCVRRADEAMYEAKNNGRNRVVVWHE